jgi:hypothetical protein
MQNAECARKLRLWLNGGGFKLQHAAEIGLVTPERVDPGSFRSDAEGSDSAFGLKLTKRAQKAGIAEILGVGFVQQQQVDPIEAEFPKASFKRLPRLLRIKSRFGLESGSGMRKPAPNCGQFSRKRAKCGAGGPQQPCAVGRKNAVFGCDRNLIGFPAEEFSQATLREPMTIGGRNVEMADALVECRFQQAQGFAFAEPAHQAGAAKTKPRGPAAAR